MRHCVSVLIASVLGVSALHAADSRLASRAERLEAIRRAQVWIGWQPVDVAAMDLKAGPPGPEAMPPGASVACTYVRKTRGAGSTPKFTCALPSGRELKVRYGRTNGEVYAQVAATRLLWALGFPANRMYPVRVVCTGCPPDPFKSPNARPRAPSETFSPATIDDKLDGDTIETKPDEGWSWKELAQVDAAHGGATLAERDALRLLAVLIQHSSNKAINQRLVCTDPPGCRRTVMMIADLGKTFGRANLLNDDTRAAVNFRAWSAMPIWTGATGCTGNLPGSLTGTLHDPVIGEAGRQMLAGLLARLSDAQLTDLFTVARVTERDPSASVADWVAAFKRKRTEIAGRHCSQ